MTRKFKAIGLALAAVFVMSAVIASGAQAAEFTSLNTETGLHEGGTFSGDQTTQHQFTAGSGIGAVICKKAHFSGTSASGTEIEPVATPEYKECTVTILGSTYTAHVNTNGCTYKFHITSTVTKDMEYTGTADVVCPSEKFIHINITNSGAETTKCTIVVGPQNGLNNITYKTNTTASPTDVEVVTNTSNVTDTTSVGGLFGCGIGNGVHTNGTYTGTTTIKGFNSKEKQIDLTVMG